MFNFCQTGTSGTGSRFLTFASLLIAFVLVICVTSFDKVIAQNAMPPLKTHATIDGAKTLADDLHQIYLEELAIVTRMYEKRNDPASFSDRQISKSAARLWKARRDAKVLELMSEPIGADLTRKLFMLAVQVDQFGLSYSRTPRGSQMMSKLITRLQRESPRFQKFLQQASNSLQTGGDPEVFIKQMEARGMQMRESLVFFRPTEHKKYLFNFESLLNSGDVRNHKLKRAQYLQQANAKMKAELAEAATAQTEMKRISQELKEKGAATLDGEVKIGGKEVFSHVAKLWNEGSANLIRANALQWMITNKPDNGQSAETEKLKKTALTALASVIESLAEHTDPGQIPELYTDLLYQISLLDHRTTGLHQVSTECENALQQLARKNPEFAERIEAYTRATSEPLKWRSRFASAQASFLSTKYPAADALLDSRGPTDTGNRPNFARRSGGETQMVSPSFNEPADWMLDETGKRLAGKSIKEDHLIRLAQGSPTAIIQFRKGHYANVAMNLSPENEIAALKKSLLVNDEHRALSFAAMDAISSAEMQDYVSIGGMIQKIHLESLLTRFIAFPNGAIALVPLGGLPQPNSTLTPMEQTCWRLDVMPKWAHHRYFTVRSAVTKPLESKTAQATN